MALFVNQNDQRTELQKKIAAELQAKVIDRSRLADRPDGVDDSQYIEGMKKTTSLAWAWAIIIIAILGIIVWLTVLSVTR
ncbi:MAG: hypothetical protein WCJ36_01645 [Candidatus Saccharibacteria bacterium]